MLKIYDGYQCGLTSIVYNFLDKNNLADAEKQIVQNELKNYTDQLLETLGKERYIHLL